MPRGRTRPSTSGALHTHTANTIRAGYVYTYRSRLPGNTKHCVLSVKNVGHSHSAGEHSHCSSPRRLRLSSPVSAACLREHGNLRSRTLRLYLPTSSSRLRSWGTSQRPAAACFFFLFFFFLFPCRTSHGDSGPEEGVCASEKDSGTNNRGKAPQSAALSVLTCRRVHTYRR